MKDLEEAVFEMHEKYKEGIQSKTARSAKQEYAFRVNRCEMNHAMELYTECKEKVSKLSNKLKEFEMQNVSQFYLSPIDRRILDWHFANLEFATGTMLNNLSLQHWDQDDAYQFSGPQMYAKDGCEQFVFGLAAGDFEINLNQAVQTIKLTENGVEIETVSVENDCGDSGKVYSKSLPRRTYYADAVLCTLPLGVLKNSVNVSERNEKNSLTWVQFNPPLPAQKIEAINRLGFGNLNKVVLVFEKIFWNLNNHLFGNIPQSTENRGELFLFTSVTQKPVLVAYIAGEAADKLEKTDDETIKNKCLDILTNMYNVALPPLVDYFITRWKSDPWSQGSYSYVAKGATGLDFDILAEPVKYPSTGMQSSDTPRLFFAGEHTIRKYPSTVHGALLSGLRESAKIANQFLGIPYAKKI